jgi:hypothetical protein
LILLLARKIAQVQRINGRQSQNFWMKKRKCQSVNHERRETVRKTHWDWLSEQSGNASLIPIGELGMEKVTNYEKAKVKTGNGINPSKIREDMGRCNPKGECKSPSTVKPDGATSGLEWVGKPETPVRDRS